MNFVIEHMAMKCGSAEAESREYTKVLDRNRKVIWFYTLEDADPAGYIYCEHTDDLNSQGFGGRTIVFRIAKTGEEHIAKGPWHSNAEALYEGTGVDLRDKHLTFVVISRARDFDRQHRTVMTDVLYRDEQPMLGSFNRGEELAQKWADELQVPVCCYSESGGGSSCGFKYPEGTQWSDWEWVDGNPVFKKSRDERVGSVK